MLQFRYAFPNTTFQQLCGAFVNVANWEKNTNLTTIEKVEQLDDDRVLMVRRHDIYNAPFITWEQVIFNRQNQSVESSSVGANPNGSPFTVERSVYRPNLASKANESLVDSYIYDVQGNGSGKVEAFKNKIVSLRKAMKFDEWAAAEQ